MKKTLILLLALSLLLCGCGKEPTPETAASTDAPEVTEVTEIPEDQEAVTEPPAEIPTITVTRQVRMASLDENGEELWHLEYTYDELGRLISERDVSNTGEETSFATVSYADTEAGLEIRYAYNDGHIATTRESRDEQGNLVLREFLQDDQMEYATIYTYDENGNLLSEETHYSDNPGVPRIEYTYDEQGNRIGHYEYDGEELTGWQEMTYDADGRCTETRSYGYDGELVSRTEHSWEGNTEIRSRMDSDGTVYMVTLVTYDEEGNLLQQETQQDGYVISCTEYTYEHFEIPAP